MLLNSYTVIKNQTLNWRDFHRSNFAWDARVNNHLGIIRWRVDSRRYAHRKKWESAWKRLVLERKPDSFCLCIKICIPFVRLLSNLITFSLSKASCHGIYLINIASGNNIFVCGVMNNAKVTANLLKNQFAVEREFATP